MEIGSGCPLGWPEPWPPGLMLARWCLLQEVCPGACSSRAVPWASIYMDVWWCPLLEPWARRLTREFVLQGVGGCVPFSSVLSGCGPRSAVAVEGRLRRAHLGEAALASQLPRVRCCPCPRVPPSGRSAGTPSTSRALLVDPPACLAVYTRETLRLRTIDPWCPRGPRLCGFHVPRHEGFLPEGANTGPHLFPQLRVYPGSLYSIRLPTNCLCFGY